jgi:hypothetical protein
LKKYLTRIDSYKTEINVYYSPNDALDKKHAERMRDVKNIILKPIMEGGHAIVKVVRNNGELNSLIKSSFE